MRGRLLAAVIALSCSALSAQTTEQMVIGADTLSYAYTPIDQSDYDQNRSDSGRSASTPLGVSLSDNTTLDFMVTPTYSATTNVGIGAAARLGYKLPRKGGGSALPSSLTLNVSASINGFYRVVVSGQNPLNDGRDIIGYGGEIGSLPTRLWGLDYNTSLAGISHRYTERNYSAWIGYNRYLARYTHLGVYADIISKSATGFDDGAQQIIADKPTTATAAGIGLNFSFDNYTSRVDVKRGFRATASFIYRPRVLGNIGYDLWQATAIFDYYQALWKGAVLAFDLYGRMQSSNTPWLLYTELGDDNRMRGYYPGRFRGNNMVATQLELRQHIWNGIGIVAWGGAGNIFSKEDPFAWRKTLPTYGVGLRYHLGSTAFRIDFGFGRDSFNAIVGINEAF